MRRLAWLTLIALTVVPPAEAGPNLCQDRLLVLSAFPGEIDPLLAQMPVTDVVSAGGRTFFLGTLRGNDVALALSGIGLVNATQTTQVALGHFACNGSTSITGIVFSGVAGGPYIGDVVVPSSWSDDGGPTRFGVDPTMLAVATQAAAGVTLERRVPTGDAACVGADPRLVRTVTLTHAPAVRFGGYGSSADGFGGRRFPCIPNGGDVFGCAPCHLPGPGTADLGHVMRFLEDAPPFVDPAFFFEYFQMPAPPDDAAAVDMETGAVARVAAANGVPFIAFRGASDGAGDPLMLPGFPFQFFFYRQLAADNAAAVALAFLEAWADA